MDALNARGETSIDILINVHKRYLASPDSVFSMYIKQKKNDYKEAEDIFEDDMMAVAENKYKSLVRVGEWNAPSKEQKRF